MKKSLHGFEFDDNFKNAIILAGKIHDVGKIRLEFQEILGNDDPKELLAKSKSNNRIRSKSTYRHEFGSILDIENDGAEETKDKKFGEFLSECKKEFKGLNDDKKDIVLHLVASHHGYARPHFENNILDKSYKDNTIEKTCYDVIGRYDRLQKKYGIWGLAYLESFLIVADRRISSGDIQQDQQKEIK